MLLAELNCDEMAGDHVCLSWHVLVSCVYLICKSRQVLFAAFHLLLIIACRCSVTHCELGKVAFVQVPLFIAQGQKILIDTRSDSYLSKVK